MKILATKAVMEGSEINFLHKENDIWMVLSEKELDDDYEIDEDNFVAIDEEYLTTRVPYLKNKLNQPNQTTINIDYKTGEININKKHLHIGIPTHFAKSSRQANAGFSLIQYMRINGRKYFKPLAILFVLLVLGITLTWIFYIPLFLYAAYQILVLLKIRDLYYSGDLGPAIVIDAANSKIAAYTNLSLGQGDYPMIRIRKTPIPKEYLKDGKRIPVAGGFQNTENYGHWNYYEPHPLPSGIKDEAVIKEKINQIPSSEWVRLKNEIKKFPTIPIEGYYPIDITSSSWKDVDIDQIVWMQFDEEKPEPFDEYV